MAVVGSVDQARHDSLLLAAEPRRQNEAFKMVNPPAIPPSPLLVLDILSNVALDSICEREAQEEGSATRWGEQLAESEQISIIDREAEKQIGSKSHIGQAPSSQWRSKSGPSLSGSHAHVPSPASRHNRCTSVVTHLSRTPST